MSTAAAGASQHEWALYYAQQMALNVAQARATVPAAHAPPAPVAAATAATPTPLPRRAPPLALTAAPFQLIDDHVRRSGVFSERDIQEAVRALALSPEEDCYDFEEDLGSWAAAASALAAAPAGAGPPLEALYYKLVTQ